MYKGVTFGKDLDQLPFTEKGDSSLSVPTFVSDVLAYLQSAGSYTC